MEQRLGNRTDGDVPTSHHAPHHALPTARLVVVTAHPGSGKTTLLDQWFDELVGGDHSPVWFERASPDHDTDQFLPRLLGLMSDAVEPHTIFLDESAELRSLLVRRQLVELIERGTGDHRFVLAQQHAARLPVARLRAAGLVVELDDEALSLDREAVARLLDDREITLTEPMLSELLLRTEGWAQGIVTVIEQLASARHEPPEEVVTQALAALSNQMVEMVESALSEAEFDLLIETSMVESLEAGLGREVVGRDVPIDIERLLDDVPFVTATTDDGQALRLHPLARRGLLDRLLAREDSAAIAARHRSAANWLEANGRFDGAIEHCLQVGQPERAADILAAKWSVDDSTVTREDVELIRVAGAEDYVPHIVTAGLVSERVGDHSGVQRAIDRVAGAQWSGPLPNGFASLDSAVVSLSGHLPAQRSAEDLERYVDVILRDETSPLGGRNLMSLFAAAQGLYWLGRFDEAIAQCENVLRGHRSVGRHTTSDQFVTVLASDLIGLLEHDLGNVDRARLHLSHSEDLMQMYDLSAMVDPAPPVSVLRPLAKAVMGAGPYRTRAAEFTRLITDQDDVSIQIHAAIELVRLLDRNRQVVEALAALDAATALIGDGEIPPLLSQRLGLLEQALRPGPGDAGPSMHVTASERSVLYLLADRSLAQNEISDQLGLSINTVKSHLRSIYQKFGVAGRSQAIEHARRRGLLVTVLPWGQPAQP